jgi:nucleoside-diphosphate-sugar epimerase
MTIFITGGTSSIGRVLITQLAQDKEAVHVLTRPTSDRRGLERPGVEFVPGDVTDPSSVRRGMAGCDRVIHMAAIVGGGVPDETWWKVNRDGTRTVLQTALDLGIRSMVQVSTIGVLGDTAPDELADEHRSIDLSSYSTLYQKTKRAADEMARSFVTLGLRVKIVYPCFGYGCSWASSHPSMAEMTLLRLARGQPVAVMGSGKNHLTLSYYKDTVRGILLALEKGSDGRDYILGGPNLTFNEIWQGVATVLHKSPPRLHVPIPVLKAGVRVARAMTGKDALPPDFLEMVSKNWNYSSARAQNELGWQSLPFTTALSETWAEYKRIIH